MLMQASHLIMATDMHEESASGCLRSFHPVHIPIHVACFEGASIAADMRFMIANMAKSAGLLLMAQHACAHVVKLQIYRPHSWVMSNQSGCTSKSANLRLHD